MKVFLLLLGLLLVQTKGLFAQELPLILDKQGTFEILSRTDYTTPGFGFTRAEITANLKEINNLISTVRQNEVLTEMMGFDGRARIYTVSMKEEQSYGLPSRISFEFAGWYRQKDGTPARGLIEPPEWSVYLNLMKPGWAAGFSSVPEFFAIPEKKVSPAPGIDVYDGECYVIFDPGRPEYWLPVTVREAFDVVFAENKKNKDEISREMSLKMLEEEWAAIPKEDWNKPATMSGMLSRVGTLPGFPLIVKVNPEYWDKSRPKSDIQFIYLRIIGNRQFLQNRTAEYLQKNSTSYHLARFEESLNSEMANSLLHLVKK